MNGGIGEIQQRQLSSFIEWLLSNGWEQMNAKGYYEKFRAFRHGAWLVISESKTHDGPYLLNAAANNMFQKWNRTQAVPHRPIPRSFGRRRSGVA